MPALTSTMQLSLHNLWHAAFSMKSVMKFIHKYLSSRNNLPSILYYAKTVSLYFLALHFARSCSSRTALLYQFHTKLTLHDNSAMTQVEITISITRLGHFVSIAWCYWHLCGAVADLWHGKELL